MGLTESEQVLKRQEPETTRGARGTYNLSQGICSRTRLGIYRFTVRQNSSQTGQEAHQVFFGFLSHVEYMYMVGDFTPIDISCCSLVWSKYTVRVHCIIFNQYDTYYIRNTDGSRTKVL